MTEMTLTRDDLRLLDAGLHDRAYDKLGAHLDHAEGRRGVRFAVVAPAAARVSVVGDFNGWDSHAHPMQPVGEGGVCTISDHLSACAGALLSLLRRSIKDGGGGDGRLGLAQ